MLCRAITLVSGCGPHLAAAYARAEPTVLHVNTFPTARSLPFYVGVDRGFFARRGLKVELEFTESSERQRAGLADGTRRYRAFGRRQCRGDDRRRQGRLS